MKLIVQYVETDGCTYSAEHTLPVEYESAEALCEYLYEAIRNAFSKGGQVDLGEYSVFASDFYERLDDARGKKMLDDEFHKGYIRVLNGLYYYEVLPNIFTLDEWFEANKVIINANG